MTSQMTQIKSKTAVTIAALITALTVGLAAPPASLAVDSTSSSHWYCSSATTPWLTYGGMAGYKCFQYSNGSGLSSAASYR